MIRRKHAGKSWGELIGATPASSKTPAAPPAWLPEKYRDRAFMRASEIAQVTGLSKSNIYRWAYANPDSYRRAGHSILIDIHALNTLIEAA